MNFVNKLSSISFGRSLSTRADSGSNESLSTCDSRHQQTTDIQNIDVSPPLNTFNFVPYEKCDNYQFLSPKTCGSCDSRYT